MKLLDRKNIILSAECRLALKFYGYIRRHLLELELLILSAVILSVLKNIPYINILIGSEIMYFIMIVLSVILLRISKQITLLFTIFLFVVALWQTLFSESVQAEGTGNLIYFLLWFVCFLYIKDIWKSS
jgi:hypothetical protein